ncbi:two-component hybrid sensor and regulator [Beggiatoa sp. PS]|nr:two-component hybrid sensor and regulator [Beggiatoa sp. PS]
MKPETILVVDDLADNLRVLIGILSQQGYKVRPARNGQQALLMARTSPPDLILLDIMMPEMDGYEVCQQLKADQKTHHIPIIFISALNEVLDKIKAFSLGAVDYITKPFQAEEVLARVETHLKLHRLHHELVQSEKMASLGRLVAGFAHELNTPLGVAVGCSSALLMEIETVNQLVNQEEVDIDELLAALENIAQGTNLTLSNIERAANLVSSFKRTAVDQSFDEVRTFQVQEVINDTINTLYSCFKKTNISIQLDCPKDIEVKSLPGALEQIITNLLMNSFIHGFDEGKNAGAINIKAQRDGNNLHVEYSDNGKGIAPENLEKIFEPFFTTHRAHGGSGLGMYICYNLITTQLQGTMTCESQLGEGVVFKMDYPIILT